MKFKRLRIKNYRGVEESTVDFAERGITLVQGPNEVGKTSLAESIHILFKFKATANTRETREIKPVHRDAGSEIELEAESGPYHFVYKKGFHKARTTELTLHAPSPANFTDDAAHDQANRILEETLDKPLWDALIVRQGDMIRIPDLSGKTALMAALDAAAGSGASDRSSENLYERVAEEYRRYYNRQDRESDELAGAAAALREARDKADALEQTLRDLDRKTERAGVLRKQLADIKSRLAIKTRELAEQRKLAGEIEAAAERLHAARFDLASAQSAAQSTRRDREERDRLIAAAAAAKNDLSAVEAELSGIEPLAGTAAALLRERSAALAGAEREERDAAAKLALARADFDYLNNSLHLDLMREREKRIENIRAAGREAEKALQDNGVDEKTVKAIRDTELELTRLSAQLETEAPRVTLRGLSDQALELDGEPVALAKDETLERAVAGGMRLTLPDRLEIAIEAGSGPERLAERRDQAAARLAELCAAAGVADPDAATAALERRRQAERTVRERHDAERVELRDLTYEDFIERVRRLAEDVAGYAAGRSADDPPPRDIDAARAARADAEEIHRQASLALEAAQAAFEAARSEHENLSDRHKSEAIRRELAEKTLDQCEAVLASARASSDDDALANAAAGTTLRLGEAAEGVARAEADLAAMAPDRVKALVETLGGTLESLRRQLGDTERELAALTTELAIRGEEGLFEAARTARIDAEVKARDHELLQAKAAAAKLLYRTMTDLRDKARQAYFAPLKRKIEELGRWVYNESFSIDMDEETLGISRRTLDGVTVPFDSLSGGTREQLSLIFRAACCIIVSVREGMPLILDDALGYSDTARLELMGAVLAKAAEQCQIIIFTCVPERYGNIGDARVVQL